MTIYSRHDEAIAYHGMSLRDYFAAAALPAVISLVSTKGVSTHDGEPADKLMLARQAYEFADAMIKARATGEA